MGRYGAKRSKRNRRAQSREVISSKNGLPIRRGVSIVAGPDNPVDSDFVVYLVVDPRGGWVLDCNDGRHFIPRHQLHEFFVLTTELLFEPWFPASQNFLTSCVEQAYHSEVCAGVHDDRFRSFFAK